MMTDFVACCLACLAGLVMGYFAVRPRWATAKKSPAKVMAMCDVCQGAGVGCEVCRGRGVFMVEIPVTGPVGSKLSKFALPSCRARLHSDDTDVSKLESL